MRIDWQGHTSMFAANAMWGLMSPVSKAIMATGAASPIFVTDMRIGGAMILFWVLSLFMKPERVCPMDLLRLFSASLFAITLNQGSFIFGVSLTSPADASIITTSMPLWAMILAAFILKEPITRKKVGGIALGATGALLLILGNRPAGAASSGGTAIWGDMLVLFAQLCYAFYLVKYKNFVSRYSLVTIMKWMFTFSFLCVLPFSVADIRAAFRADITPQMAGGLAYVVVCGTFLCYMLVVIGQKRLRPTVAGMYNYIQPVVACIVAVCWGMDRFTVTKSFAILLIFCGVYLVTASRAHAPVSLTKASS